MTGLSTLVPLVLGHLSIVRYKINPDTEHPENLGHLERPNLRVRGIAQRPQKLFQGNYWRKFSYPKESHVYKGSKST